MEWNIRIREREMELLQFEKKITSWIKEVLYRKDWNYCLSHRIK